MSVWFPFSLLRLPSRRRRTWQFGLRTVLAVTLGAGIACAMLAARRDAKRTERETVEKLRQAGVRIPYNWEVAKRKEPAGPAWLRRLLGENFFSELDGAVHMRGDAPSDATLQELTALRSIRKISLSDTPRITRRGFRYLASLDHLEEISLHGRNINDACLLQLTPLREVKSFLIQDSSVTDVGMAVIENWKLRTLWVERTPITDATLAFVGNQHDLHWIELKREPITDAGATHLAGLTQLKTLGLDGTQITDAALGKISALTELEYLDLCDTKVTDEGMRNLQSMHRLKNLLLARTGVQHDGLRCIGRLTSLESLNLDCNNVTDEALRWLAELPHLDSLFLAGPYPSSGIEPMPHNPELTDAGLVYVGQMMNLENLELSRTAITDAGIVELGKLPKLKILQIHNTRITPAGVLRLRQLLRAPQILQ